MIIILLAGYTTSYAKEHVVVRKLWNFAFVKVHGMLWMSSSIFFVSCFATMAIDMVVRLVLVCWNHHIDGVAGGVVGASI